MLGRLWAQLVQGRRTVGKVAADFGSQLAAVKLILFEWFAADFAKNGVTGPIDGAPSSDLSRVYSGQVVNFLTGELFESFPEGVPDAVGVASLRIADEVPTIAANLMKQDRNLCEVVVYTLRMRVILGCSYEPGFLSTQQGERINFLLQTYGREFKDDAVDERRYAAIVNNLINWSRSAAFPGKQFK